MQEVNIDTTRQHTFINARPIAAPLLLMHHFSSLTYNLKMTLNISFVNM